MNETTVCVIGVGKLGAPMAACLASKGYPVVAADTDDVKIAALNRGDAPVQEPGLQEMLKTTVGRIRATRNVREAVQEAEITFIIVPTPSEENGEFSLRYALAACHEVGKALRETSAFHVVVVTSTVMPGATGGPLRDALEAASGLRCGEDFGLCYSPEFIALGSVIHDMLHPDFVLIGESDTRSGDILAALYARLCDNLPVVARMNFVNAELAKLAVNTYVTTKISYANMLSEICERLPGGDCDVVTAALGLDSRIGRKYLKGATGYGGPCFPRDNRAFVHLARRLDTHATLAEATDTINRRQEARLAQAALSRLSTGGCVGILGLAYKPNTDVVTEAAGVGLAMQLVQAGAQVVAYDPAGMDNARGLLDEHVALAASVSECVERADILVITTPWDEFRVSLPRLLAKHGSSKVVIDCWNILDPAARSAVSEYVALGHGQDDQAK